MKNIPQRMCIGCNTRREKTELLRIVRTLDGKITVDKSGKMDGRGAYICNNEKCLDIVIKSQRLKRFFKITIDSKIYEDIRGVIIGK